MTDTKPPEPQTFMFADDGSVPNNARLPFVVYRRVIDLIGSPDPEQVIENVFRGNGWGDMWRNGIFPYVHYHSMIHEGMGIARGRAKVRFGGNKGAEVELIQGDVAVLPAGTGHQCLWASPDLMVIGAYPQDRQIRPLPRQQGRARQGAANHPAGAAARLRSGVRQAGSAAAALAASLSKPRVTPCPSSGWIEFWDSKHSIYVNARHEAAHFRRIAEDIRAYAPPGGVMLDYGCGEALSADRVAEPVARLILCEPAPNVRVMLGARFAGNDKIAVRKPEDVAIMPARLDRRHRHAFGSAIPERAGARRAAEAVPPPAQAGRAAGAGRRDPAQALDARRRAGAAAIRPAGGLLLGGAAGPRSDLFSPTTGGCANRSAWPATTGAEITAKLEARASRWNPRATNIGHNNKRMTFLAHAR